MHLKDSTSSKRIYSLSHMTWEDVKEALPLSPVVLLPVGATEQHGRHLPLGTDTFAAIDIAEGAAKQCQIQQSETEPAVVVAPPIWYGMSSHHMALPGTVSVRPEVLLELTYDIVASLSEHGFMRLILINGHRITNVPWLQLVAERAQRLLPGCRVAIFDLAWMSREIAGDLGFGPVGHAEEIETSHMLAAWPELTRMERAQDHPPSGGDGLHRSPSDGGGPRLSPGGGGKLYHVDPRINRDTLCYVPTAPEAARAAYQESAGVTGRPTLADSDKGQRYRDHLITRLVETINLIGSRE